MEVSIKEDGADEATWKGFMVRSNVLPVLYMITLMFFQQASGIGL